MPEIILCIADVHSGFWVCLFVFVAAIVDIMHCFCFLCICQMPGQGTRGMGQGGKGMELMARHLHATYEINYYALSPKPSNHHLPKCLPVSWPKSTTRSALCSTLPLGLGLRGRGIGIACPAHSNFQGTRFLVCVPSSSSGHYLPLPLVAHYGDGCVAGKVRSLTAAGWPVST